MRFWEIHHFLPGTCGCEDGSCLLTTWESEKCLRTVIRQWDSGRRGQSIWGQVHREDPSQQIIPKCISRMNFLFLPSFVINYFSFSMEKKSEKFILCLSIFYLITWNYMIGENSIFFSILRSLIINYAASLFSLIETRVLIQYSNLSIWYLWS